MRGNLRARNSIRSQEYIAENYNIALDITKTPQGTTISGTIVTTDATPAPFHTARLFALNASADAEPLAEDTIQADHFEFVDVAPGQYRLQLVDDAMLLSFPSLKIAK